MKRKIDILLPAVFICFIAAVLLMNLGNIAGSVRAQTGKVAQLHISEALDGFETRMNSSFSHKLDYVRVNSGFQTLLGQKIINNTIRDNNGNVYAMEVTEEKWDEKTTERDLSTTEKILDTAEKTGAYTLYVQHPDKFDPDTDTLPYGYKFIRSKRDDFYTSRLERDGYNVLDLRDSRYSDTQKFYKTDHHWTIGSAFNANAHILDFVRDKSGLISSEDRDAFSKLYSRKSYKTRLYEDSFLGSDGIRAVPLSGKEDFTEFYPAYDTSFTYLKNGAGHTLLQKKSGDFEDAFISTDLLRSNSYVNKYDTYLNEGHIENISVNHNAPNDLKVLIISDSFSRPMHTFMSTNFREVRSLDPQEGRYNESYTEYIKEYKPDIVILMYDLGYYGDSVE